MEAGLALEAVFAEPSASVPASLGTAGPPLVAVAPGALDRVGDVATSQGLLAIAAVPAAAPLPVGAGPLLVAVDIADPGNLGTMLRSAEAAGAAAVVVVGGVDPWAPKVVRAAAGALFRAPIVAVDDPFPLLVEAGAVPLAAVARGGTPHDRCNLSGPVAFLVGSEAHGLDDATIARCAERVTIELAGPTESLNAAMAATVLLFEALRQRRASGAERVAGASGAERVAGASGAERVAGTAFAASSGGAAPGPLEAKNWTSPPGRARVGAR